MLSQQQFLNSSFSDEHPHGSAKPGLLHTDRLYLGGPAHVLSTMGYLCIPVPRSHVEFTCPQPSNFLKIVLAIFGPLLFHIRFRINSFVLIKIHSGMLVEMPWICRFIWGNQVSLRHWASLSTNMEPNTTKYFIHFMFPSHGGPEYSLYHFHLRVCAPEAHMPPLRQCHGHGHTQPANQSNWPDYVFKELPLLFLWSITLSQNQKYYS